MRFVSFNTNTTPVIPGKVKMLSPDRKSSGQPGKDEEFYLSQVEATPEGLAMLGSLKVQPGMPVDVVFKTGERTFLSYLFKPLSDKMAKAFQDI
jgi:protease secretion system membrane fusion protein